MFALPPAAAPCQATPACLIPSLTRLRSLTLPACSYDACAVDVWASGVLLYLFSTGAYPFGEQTMLA